MEHSSTIPPIKEEDGASQLRWLEVGKEIVVKGQGALVTARLIACKATDSEGKKLELPQKLQQRRARAAQLRGYQRQ